jgi:hypothetical protein
VSIEIVAERRQLPGSKAALIADGGCCGSTTLGIFIAGRRGVPEFGLGGEDI